MHTLLVPWESPEAVFHIHLEHVSFLAGAAGKEKAALANESMRSFHDMLELYSRDQAVFCDISKDHVDH